MLIVYNKMQNIDFKFLKHTESHQCRFLQSIKIMSDLHKIFKISEHQQ